MARRFDTELAAIGGRGCSTSTTEPGEPLAAPMLRRLAVRNLLRGYRLRHAHRPGRRPSTLGLPVLTPRD